MPHQTVEHSPTRRRRGRLAHLTAAHLQPEKSASSAGASERAKSDTRTLIATDARLVGIPGSGAVQMTPDVERVLATRLMRGEAGRRAVAKTAKRAAPADRPAGDADASSTPAPAGATMTWGASRPGGAPVKVVLADVSRSRRAGPPRGEPTADDWHRRSLERRRSMHNSVVFRQRSQLTEAEKRWLAMLVESAHEPRGMTPEEAMELVSEEWSERSVAIGEERASPQQGRVRWGGRDKRASISELD